MKKKYLLYMIFAAVCTAVNLGSQAILKMYLIKIDELHKMIFIFKLHFIIQLLIGTFLGFVTKFILDKFLVFKDTNKDVSHTFKQIAIYAIFALLTTCIFWGIEIGFKLLFTFDNRELIGGFIGLAIGYTVKFFLDKKFVFIKNEDK